MEIVTGSTEALKDLDDDWRVGLLTNTSVRLTVPGSL